MSTSSLASCVSSTSDGASSSRAAASSNLPINKIYDKCPSCKVQFDFLKRTNFTKVPLILNCKHTVCEDCIRRLCLANKTFCPVCNEKFTVLRSQLDNLTEVFQPHFTLIGHLVWTKNFSNKKEICWVSTGRTLKDKYGGGEFPDIPLETETLGDLESENVALPFVFDKCSEHTDHYINIQCEDCEDTFCCYCFLENHTGHKATYLYKLNETEMEELEKYKADAEVVLAQLLMSRKQAKNLKGFDASDVEQDIKSYFIDLHAKLHLAERNIRKKLSTMQSADIDVDTVNLTLKSATQRVTQLLDHFNLPDKKQLHMRAILEEAKAVKHIPCRLISDKGTLRPIEFLSDNAFDDIEESVFLKDLPSVEYSLLPMQDWTQAQEKYEMNQIRRHTETEQPEQKCDVVAAVREFKETERRAKKMVDGKTRIVVTHINDVNSFYIQKYSTLDSLKDMNNLIGRRSRKKRGNEEFKLGGIYGVQYETKNSSQWRRGKIMDISRNENDVCQYKTFFIDYGNTQTVTGDKLREIDVYTIKRQNFAEECKLANLDGLDLDPNVHLQLPQIVGQKELYVRYLGPKVNRKCVQEVEILVSASNGGVISVTDLLVKKPSAVPNTKHFVLSSETRLFKNSNDFRIGQDEQVVVTYIKNPFYICVQLARHLKSVEKMNMEMEEYYKTAPVLESIPVIDTDVVVEYEDAKHGKYHRAKIIAVNIGSKEVTAFFVDWGKDVVVPWSKLKSLTQNFIKVECQGIIIKLAHLDKVIKSRPWSSESIEFLRTQVSQNKEWKMVVVKVDILEVALFKPTPSGDICLNSLLVEENLAVSTGTITETVLWPSMMEPPVEEDDDFCFQLIRKAEKILLADEDKSDLTPKFQVDIIDLKSPDFIYVKFSKYRDADAELHKEMQIHYKSEKSPTKHLWKIGESCVVFDSERNDYFRAVIRSATKNHHYKVFLIDHARDLNVHKKEIFVQDLYFQNFPCHVLKCRLSRIKPAGDGGKWSQLAIEMLQKIFSRYKNIYVAKMEVNTKNKMAGVTMWYSFTTAAKALEPAKVHYISINQTLLESGVAFVDSSTVNVDIKPDVEQQKDKKLSWNDMISEAEENSTNEVTVSEHSEDDDFYATFQDGWPKPFKIQKREFNAVLICIVSQGYFLVRDEQLQSLYREVEEGLNSTFNSQIMTSNSSDVEWEVGQMCTICYEGLWYRGTVLDILSPMEFNVEMIDFGSAHIVLKDDLSKGLMFPDCPPLVYKVQLYDVNSKYGEWTAEDVEELLSIVSDSVKISIKGHLDIEVPFAEVYLDNGLSVNDLFTRRCPHMVRSENHVVLETLTDEDKDLDELNDSIPETYTYVGFPQVSEKLQKMFIVNLLKFDCGYCVVLRTEENNTSKNFLRLCDTIQKTAEQQKPLKQLKIDTPCICMHSEKKMWSRAVIYSVNSLQFGFVLVFFVDYGTVEMISVDKLKEVRSEWLDYPVYLHIASIGIELEESSQGEFVLMQMSNLRGTYVSVKVVSDDPLKVHLYSDNRLIYQDLIDCGIVKVA